MSRRSRIDILTLRLSVGFLGEAGQHAWWPSGFLAPTARPFLRPVFENATLVAQYHGVAEAARRVHDERIGIGQVSHLFRLSESVEHGLFELLTQAPVRRELADCVGSAEAAETKLKAIGSGAPDVSPGPVRIGRADATETAESVATLAAYYLAAFTVRIQCFPYFSNRS
jgi:hypothetical protein